MAVTLYPPQQTSPTQFTFTFSSDLTDPTFYIYINGEFVSDTKDTEWVVTASPNTQFQFDVLDVSTDTPEEFFPSTFTLRWDGTPDSTTYRVEQYVSDEWVAKHVTVADDTRVFHYKTEMLDDSTTYQFRVVPIDGFGRDGTTLEFEAEMCRYPDAPTQSMTATGGEIVVA